MAQHTLVASACPSVLVMLSAWLAIRALQDGGMAKNSTESASVGNSYLVNLAKVPNLKLSSDTSVRCITFLHGYTEPVLLLLYETVPTWGGRCVAGGGQPCPPWVGRVGLTRLELKDRVCTVCVYAMLAVSQAVRGLTWYFMAAQAAQAKVFRPTEPGYLSSWSCATSAAVSDATYKQTNHAVVVVCVT